MNMNVPPPTDLAGLPTPAVSDAVDALSGGGRVTGFTSPAIKNLFPSLPPWTAVARTIEIETLDPSAGGGGLGPLFLDLLDAIEAENGPVVVVAKEAGSCGTAAHVGEVIATILKRVGAVALLTDGAVRDVNRLGALGLPVYAAGTVVSKGNARLKRIGEPVEVAGLSVNDGSVLHGDANGVLNIDGFGAAPLATTAGRIVERENGLKSFLNGPNYSFEELKRILGGAP